MPQGKLRKAVEKSIKNGLSDGTIDENRDAAPIAMLQYMADMLDSDDCGASIVRYVSPAAFLTYCEKLGFVPDIGQGDRKNTKAKVVELVGNSKWKRA